LRPAAARRVFRCLALSAFLFLPASAGDAAHTYLILPFEDSAPDGSRDWLQEAMVVSLSDYFIGAGQHVVDRDDRLLAMDEMNLPPGAPLTLATSLRLGKNLRSRDEGPAPDRLVVGRFSLTEGQMTLSARLLRLDANAAAPWKEESGNLKDLLQIQKSLAHALLHADGIGTGNLASQSDDAGAGHAFPLVAYESYIRGLIDPQAARQITYLRKAVEQSPGYPKACYQLARVLVRSGKRGEADSVLKGAAGDPAPYAAEYHALKGSLDLDGGRISEAEAEARQSMGIKDTSGVHVLLARIARAQADPVRARQELDKAEALDPDNPDVEPLRHQLAKEAPPHS